MGQTMPTVIFGIDFRFRAFITASACYPVILGALRQLMKCGFVS